MGTTSFEAIFGYIPYHYQLQVAEALAHGQNVLLRAPTGAGKTEAALYPFFTPPSPDFPGRLLYVAPMRVLVRQLAQRCREKAGDRRVAIQTGDQQDDPYFTATATFTTIDQMLSSFMHVPYALSRSRGNINAGAVVSSYVVIDEFHLLDPNASFATTFEVLRLCQQGTPFVLMTATCSDALARDLARELEAKCVAPSSDELSAMSSQRKVRRWRRCNELLSAQPVLHAHRNLPLGRRRSIAVCNTVERAQQLFSELRAELDNSGTTLILLHSRFTQEHRQAHEKAALHLFGKDAPENVDAILIATQVIEVGLDISCEALHTELAPVTSLIQRAGRCARREGEEGTVYVYDLPRDERGVRRFTPYQDYLPNDTLPALIERTWAELEKLPDSHIDWETENLLVEAVQGETDRAILSHLHALNLRPRIRDVIATQQYGNMRQLIRHDDSVTVIVHGRPESLSSPYEREGFSLFHGTVRGWFQEIPQGLPWLAKLASESKSQADAELSGQPPTWIWQEIKDHRAVVSGSILAINPAVVSYDKEIGLQFKPPESLWESPSVSQTQRLFEKYRYRAESYVEHIQRVIAIYDREHAHLIRPIAARLERGRWPEGMIDRACRIAIALHDAGKLTRAWQDWAHRWQQVQGKPVADDFLLAHTDYDPNRDATKQPFPMPRPSHAVEGALAVSPWLRQLLPEHLGQIVLSAIARHHAPLASNSTPFVPHPGAAQALKEALSVAGINAAIQGPLYQVETPISLDIHLLPRDLDWTLLVYSIIVRALRMADWAGTAS